jgi:uncharacterized protein YdbL (DUF1318 family)
MTARTPTRAILRALLLSLPLVALAGLLLPAPATAISLDQAKREGLVGERPDGYVGAVSPTPSAEVKDLVARVNARRKKVYEDIAKKRGTSVEAVAGLAGQDLIAKAKPGEYVLKGSWTKK